MSDSAAKAIRAALTRSRPKTEPTQDEFAKAVQRKLEIRGVIKPSEDDAAAPEWYDALIELDRRHREFEAEREKQREVEAEAQLPIAARLSNRLAGRTGNDMPLNSAGIIRAALAGGYGTIEGRNE